jgi:hypothetical protein
VLHCAKQELPELFDQAPDGKVIKAGLIGCGGRGASTGKLLSGLVHKENLYL